MTGFQTVNVSEVDDLTWKLSAAGWAGGNTTCALFTNDPEAGKTPAQVKALVHADFTAATFAGYAAKTLVAATWVITAGLPTAAVYPLQTFSRSSTGAAQIVRGYWLRRNTDNRILGYEYFPGPMSFEFIGDEYSFNPRVAKLDSDDPT